ncbi:hypothetical protein ATJ88_2589 [Isoptericola jiangsuensis]|uniref:MYXO-CTERM domain-containing protein n=2 Tax=Isoptericola jiangsuensis TaxID=548579 RepID=A0A2A9EYN9_9MICO|nr:hypothetical protein ATJ88_2589 [Isoptericola jiangsuensis]
MSWTVRAAATLVAGLALAGLTVGPADAHGGDLDVEIGTDGAGGISAAVVWKADGHPVEESAVVVVRATSDDGATVGPVTLTSASEGVGWYRSEPDLLAEGHWTVTARVTEPEKAKVVTEIDVAAPPAPPEPADDPTTSPATEDAAAADGSAADAAAATQVDAAAGPGAWPWVVAALVAVAAVTGVLLARRRRS